MMSLTLDEVVRAVQGRPSGVLAPVCVRGVSTDSRTVEAGEVFFALRGARFDGHAHVDEALAKGAVAAVVALPCGPDSRPVVYVGDTIEALGRLAAFHRSQRSTHVIAVTGSNGKTTTKCMIDHVLSGCMSGRSAPRSFNNAVGVPLTLLSAQAGDDYLVVELGTNARGEISGLAKMAAPTVGVITSIGDAHLDGLTDRRGVATEKAALLDHVRPGGLAVLNADTPELHTLLSRAEGRTVVTFGMSDAADVRVTDVETEVDSTAFRINGKFAVTMPYPGAHSAMNAAAAFAVCRRLKVDPERIVESLATFAPPPMRLNVWRVGKLTVIDDSYNANPSSTQAAIEVLRSARGGRRVFVGGEMLELGVGSSALHERTGRSIAEAGVSLLVAIGEHAPDLISGAHAGGKRLDTIMYADTETACRDLPNWLAESDTVLIKGSRKLALDRVAKRVRETFA